MVGIYQKAYRHPVQAPYRMAQSLLGLKLAVEKAMAANGGKPTGEQLAAALTNLEWDSPAGRIRMAAAARRCRKRRSASALRRGQEDGGLDDIQRFRRLRHPPPNMKSEDWLKPRPARSADDGA